MVSRKDLEDYMQMINYLDDMERKRKRIESEISSLTDRLAIIEGGELVVDKVRGGEGGIQNYRIEGVPTVEYRSKKTRLQLRKLALEGIESLIDEQTEKIENKTCEIEQFIAGIDDIYVKRIVNLRCIERLTWAEVACAMGGNNTEESVRKIFSRFFESCPICPL